jgi:hypothetical protein
MESIAASQGRKALRDGAGGGPSRAVADGAARALTWSGLQPRARGGDGIGGVWPRAAASAESTPGGNPAPQ